jgi:alpha-D-ribose 1-methylphosphonate 5-triphosphate synthase subunit PhnG
VTILQFPSSRAFAIRIERETDDLGWMVLTHDREHAWLCGEFDAALCDAREVAAGLDVIIKSTGISMP